MEFNYYELLVNTRALVFGMKDDERCYSRTLERICLFLKSHREQKAHEIRFSVICKRVQSRRAMYVRFST